MKRVILTVDNNQGYSAEQIDTRMTLGDLLEMVQNAVDEHGEDAVVVTKDTGNRYGANWGRISQWESIEGVDSDSEGDAH